jgi:predicted transposase/invertase (TIGR01784 family)
MQLYDQMYRSSRRGKLPAVFPVLLYNGSKRWTVPRNIRGLIEEVVPAKYIPSFEYYTIVERDIPDRVLKHLKGLMSAVIYLEKQQDRESLGKALDTAIELIAEERPEQLRMFTTWVNAMFRGSLSEEDMEKITDLTEVRSMLSELVDEIAEDKKREGIEEGKREGIQEARKENALRMIRKGYPLEEIQEITGLSSAVLEELKRETEGSDPR